MGDASAALWGLEVGDGTAVSPYRETPPRREWRVGDFLIEIERFVCRRRLPYREAVAAVCTL